MERSQALVRRRRHPLHEKNRYLFSASSRADMASNSPDEEKANGPGYCTAPCGSPRPEKIPRPFKHFMYSLKHYWPEEFKAPPAQPDAPPQGAAPNREYSCRDSDGCGGR